MTGVMSNFGRLAKLLELTASSHDGEALAAVRMANEERERLGLTWTELIAERPLALQCASGTAPARPPARRREPPLTACWTAPGGATWEAVFQVIYDQENLSNHWAEILESIQGYYIERGWLTTKQSNLVLKFLAAAQEQAA